MSTELAETVSRQAVLDTIDDRIFCLLDTPGMWSQSAEGLLLSVLENLSLRWILTSKTAPSIVEFWKPLGLTRGNRVIYPDRLSDEFVDCLKNLCLKYGYQVGDRQQNNLNYRAHWDACIQCRTSHACHDGQLLWQQKAGIREFKF